MAGIRATAPGKLVIAGEYAVLYGGSAIAVAVGRRAEARLNTGGECSELHIANTEERYGFELTRSALQWHQDPGAQGDLLEAAVTVLSASGAELSKLAPFTLQLCSREFYTVKDAVTAKLGLGSSAAIAVALSSCLQHAVGERPDVATALAVHREFQSGQGSGIDVCTSYYGGTIALAADNGGDSATVRPIVWPEQLHILPVWTGRTASTAAMLQHLNKYAVTQPAQHAELISSLSARSAAVLHACTDEADVTALLTSLIAFTEELRAFDDATGLGIWSAEHIALAQLADKAGLVYKPSGAGGGDFGLAFATDREMLATFQDSAERAGFGCPALELGVDGLELG